MTISRRKLLLRLGFYGVPASCLGYGALLEKNRLSVSRVDVPLPPQHSGLDGIKIALMSDFHHDDFGNDRLIQHAVKTINQEGADLAILGGDYISHDLDALEPLCESLSDIRTRLGTFGVYGNHDRTHFDPAIPRLLREGGVRLLDNDAAVFPEFSVVGMDSSWTGTPRLQPTLDQLETDQPVILGWHEPDTFDRYDDSQIALQVSGHTHGGQVCAPFFGPILLPKHGRKYPFGLYRKESRSLYVTRGIGTLNIPARFLCPPELAILSLKAG